MPKPGKSRLRPLLPYGAAAALLVALPLAAYLTGLSGGWAAFLAVLIFLACWLLLGKVEKGAETAWLLDEKLLQTQKLAALGELAAGIAHEINNPLAVIRQEAEWMQALLKKPAADLPELAELRDSLREILQQVERSREITHNLLNLARKREPVIQEVDLNRLLESMAVLVEKETRPRNIELIRDYQPGLPRLWSDPPLLRQVALNLLNNARQAITGPGAITIATRQADAEHVTLTVQDTGKGIPPENLTKVFDPFFTTKPPGQGTGLGLALCHAIVHRLGGEITVESEMGEGATFIVRLPIMLMESYT